MSSCQLFVVGTNLYDTYTMGTFSHYMCDQNWSMWNDCSFSSWMGWNQLYAHQSETMPSFIYTLCPKKVVHQTHGDNFVNS